MANDGATERSDQQLWLTLWFHSVYTLHTHGVSFRHTRTNKFNMRIIKPAPLYHPSVTLAIPCAFHTHMSSHTLRAESVLHCNFKGISQYIFLGSALFVFYVCADSFFCLVILASGNCLQLFFGYFKMIVEKKYVSYLRDLFALLNILLFIFVGCFCPFLWERASEWVHCICFVSQYYRICCSLMCRIHWHCFVFSLFQNSAWRKNY